MQWMEHINMECLYHEVWTKNPVCYESEDTGIQVSVCVLYHHHLKLKMKFAADYMDK